MIVEGKKGRIIFKKKFPFSRSIMGCLSLQCVDLPTMVHPAMVGMNNEDIENSDGESDSADSPEAAEESESDEKQKEKGRFQVLSSFSPFLCSALWPTLLHFS